MCCCSVPYLCVCVIEIYNKIAVRIHKTVWVVRSDLFLGRDNDLSTWKSSSVFRSGIVPTPNSFCITKNTEMSEKNKKVNCQRPSEVKIVSAKTSRLTSPGESLELASLVQVIIFKLFTDTHRIFPPSLLRIFGLFSKVAFCALFRCGRAVFPGKHGSREGFRRSRKSQVPFDSRRILQFSANHWTKRSKWI